MTRLEALSLIPVIAPDTPLIIPESALAHLDVTDLPEGISLIPADGAAGTYFTAWDGALFRKDGALGAFCSLQESRESWDNLIAAPYYFDLLRRALERRQRAIGDVEFCNWEDNGSTLTLEFLIRGLSSNLSKAHAEVLSCLKEIEEPARFLSSESGKIGTEIAGRVSGLSGESLEKLLECIQTSNEPNAKGRALEEIVANMFQSIEGLKMAGRLRTLTATEEIDISLLNASSDPVLSREEAFILVECKNWSEKCGRSDFSLLREKMLNRKARCSLAFLVSWNGFSEKVTTEMLRGSREKQLIVPLTGIDIREAVARGDFKDVFFRNVHAAIHL